LISVQINKNFIDFHGSCTFNIPASYENHIRRFFFLEHLLFCILSLDFVALNDFNAAVGQWISLMV